MNKCKCCGKNNSEYPTPGYIPTYKEMTHIMTITIVVLSVLFYIIS